MSRELGQQNPLKIRDRNTIFSRFGIVIPNRAIPEAFQVVEFLKFKVLFLLNQNMVVIYKIL